MAYFCMRISAEDFVFFCGGFHRISGSGNRAELIDISLISAWNQCRIISIMDCKICVGKICMDSVWKTMICHLFTRAFHTEISHGNGASGYVHTTSFFVSRNCQIALLAFSACKKEKRVLLMDAYITSLMKFYALL